MTARGELIRTSVTRTFPEVLECTDEIALTALDLYEAEDFYGAMEYAVKAYEEYTDLLFAARTYLVREEIVSRGFVSYDFNNFIRADDSAWDAIDAFIAYDLEAAREHAEEAALRYNLVLSNGWMTYARIRQEAAARERALAIEERADIATRETFRAADTIFSQAERVYATRDYPTSSLAHLESEAMFAIARQETRERRLRAEEAIRLAEEAIELVNEAAVEADRIIEGGSR
jgi:hypothetical protein